MNERLEHAFIKTEIENWNDFFLLHQRFLSRFVFRGQGNSEWKLQTSLERLIDRIHPHYIDKSLPASYEKRMLEEFIWKFPLYNKEINLGKEEHIEWLALMQHYGSPTRMLDFSNSLFVALFMAIDGYSFDRSTIWAINVNRLNMKIFELFRAEYDTNVAVGKELTNYIYSRANKAIANSMRIEPLEKELYIVEPNICNERLNRQQGLFVIPANIENSFESNLFSLTNKNQTFNMPIKKLITYSNSLRYSQTDIALMRIDIPKCLNFELTKVLKQMNITAETLYPGIEGLAKSMSCIRNAMGDYKH